MPPFGSPSRPRPSPRAAMLAIALGLALALTACGALDRVPVPGAPGTAVKNEGTTTAGVADGQPITGTVEVWLGDYGLMPWRRRLVTPGRYYFSLVNFGREPHDLAIVQAPGGITSLPTRQERILLQDLELVARSEPVQPHGNVDPGEGSVVAELGPGRYVLFSTEGRDFGRGMAVEIMVGGGNSGPEPPPPPESTGEAAAVYLVDSAIFLSRDLLQTGTVRLEVHNLGQRTHDLVVVRWRGSPLALPVEGDAVLLDGLIEVGRLPALRAGESGTLEIEVSRAYAYVAFSAAGTDYVEGMRAQFFVR